MTMRRRDALKTIGTLAGAAGLSRILQACGGNGGPDGITTIVYMMMENRSYDHVLGSRGFLEGKPGDGMSMSATNNDVNGTPVALWEPPQADLCDLDPPHDWDSAHLAWNNGANDQFVIAHQMAYSNMTTAPDYIEPMQYLTRTEMPVTWALADAYTTCDRWFCSVMGPTWPNRFYWHLGTSQGVMTNTLPASLNGTSIYALLEAKNVPWKYYFHNIPVVSLIQGIDQSNVQRFENFIDDAMAGTLPPVVYIDPGFYENDDHPPIHPINGQQLIATVYTALANSPQWKNCLFVVTYDENGGFYDHVSPPTSADDNAAQGFDQMGFRVPTMVMGPYAKTSYVSSTVYDHTSALKHLQNTFDLDPLSMRTTAANDLTDCLDMDRLQAGTPNDPIDIPMVDPTTWPMGPECTNTSDAEGHSVLELAQQHPEIFGQRDFAAEAHTRQRVRDFMTRMYAAKQRGRKVT